MAEIKLPELGENIESGEVVSILVSEGDTVEKDQALLELETGKATVEVPATSAGTVKEIKVAEGDEVNVGAVIIILDGDGEGAAEKKEEEKKEKKEEKEEKKKKPAPKEKPKEDARKPVAEKEAADEEEAEEAREAATEKEEGDEQPAEKSHAPTSSKKAAEKPAEKAQDAAVPAAPSTRRFAREIGIEIGDVKGSGPGGRITVDDVKRHSRESRKAAPGTAPAVEVDLPDFSQWGNTRSEKMSKIRRVTADHMARSWALIPHVTQYDLADVTELEETRRELGEKAEKAGGKLTMTVILAKIIAAALKVHPKFNASLDLENEQIIYKDYINVGIAVDTDRGLLVPVIRDVDKKNIIEISVELRELAKKTREGKISPDQLQGGTFTITNVGVVGGTYFTPIINWPEVAILGVGRTYQHYIPKKDGWDTRLIMPLSLSFDHRIIDGGDGIRFVKWLVDALNEPFMVILEG